MSTAIVSRFLAFATVGGRTMAQFGDEFGRVMSVYGDDFARNMGSADELTNFISQNADDIARQAGANGDDFVRALRSAAPGMFQQASRLGSGLDDVMRGFQRGGADDFAAYLRTNEQAIRARHGDTIFEVLNSSAPQIQTRIATGAGAGVADDVAARGATAADDVAGAASLNRPGFFGRNPTYGKMILWGITPTAAVAAFAVAEHESGGAISEAAIDGVIDTVRAGIDSGIITHENLEAQINTAGYIAAVANWGNRSLQNQAVRHAIGNDENPTPEDILNGKITAVVWQLTNLPVLAAKNIVRAGIVDEVYPDRDEADQYLADQFINDLVEGAEVRALGDNPVTRDDVKIALERAMQNPATGLVVNGRIENGLRQIWPDLFPEEVPGADASQEQAPDARSPFASAFDTARDRIGEVADDAAENWLMSNPFFAAIAAFFQWIGELLQGLFGPLLESVNNGDALVQGDPNRAARVLAQNGMAPEAGATAHQVTHDGRENEEFVLDPALTPAPAPGMRPAHELG